MNTQYHVCLPIMKLMKTFGKSLLDMKSVSFFSTSFAWTIYHSGKHSTTSAQGVCRKECRPLCSDLYNCPIKMTITTTWWNPWSSPLSTLVKQLSNGSFKVITSNTADNSNPAGCYTVLLGTKFPTFMCVTFLRDCNSAECFKQNYPPFCMYVCMKQFLTTEKWWIMSPGMFCCVVW